MPPTQWLGLAGWLLLCFAVSGIGALASANAASFYSGLARPAWSPPGWVFGPVWTALYLSMAMAAWLVWRTPAHRERTLALALFLAQLAANALWSWLFFSWRRADLAFAEVLVLWLLIALTLAAFLRVRPLAGWLLLPYLLWVSFASALNWALWRANPGIFG